MLMLKMSITTNSTIKNKNQETNSAATASVTQEHDKWEHIDNISQDDVGMDGAEDFEELTDEVFDNVLSQCEQNQRTHIILPHKKPKTSNPKGLRPGGSGRRK